MARAPMTRARAFEIANRHRIPLGLDFHALDSAQVDNVRAAADDYGYRAPRNRNGSRCRYFFAFLERASRRPE